jgi:hypothetical protein
MQKAVSSAVLSLLSAFVLTGAALGNGPVEPPAQGTIHLDTQADLEDLRQTNLNHYLRARTILAAANEICSFGPDKTYMTRFADAHPRCGQAMWKMSHPPKKELSFQLDDVHYVALVTVTRNAGEPVLTDDNKGSR